MLESALEVLAKNWFSSLIVALCFWLLKNRFNRGLNKHPGPFLASFTDWWRFVDVYRRRPDITQQRLHEQLGDIVRLGPNTLSFASPKAIKAIYGLNKGFIKSEFYPVQQALANGKRLPSLFSTTDEAYHAQLRRCINSAFSMSALIQYEPAVDVVTKKFLDQTELLYASTSAVCNFAQWLQFYAFDGIGHITYSKSHGFVDRNEDVDGMVAYLGNLFSYVAPIGQIPALDLVFLKNPVLRILDRYKIRSSTFPVVTFARARMGERLAEMKEKGREGIEKHTGKAPAERADLLSQFLKAKEQNPTFFNDDRVQVMAVSVAFAGSETTAISLAAVFYYLLRHPLAMSCLVRELDNAVRDGKLEDRSDGLTSWSEAQSLPYLDAVIKESFRMHPAAGLPLERVVPPQGADICGTFVPGGTIVGCNAWVVHRRPEVFGPNPYDFRPERWLEVSDAKRREMDGTLFHFGAGARTCIGKNISLLEMYKLVPSFLRRFEIQFADPNQDWKLHNAWFVKQLNFNTTFRSRKQLSAQ